VSLWFSASACQSLQQAMFDDDCSSTRLTFWEDEAQDGLPSPREASEEALRWMQERDAQLLAAKESPLDGVDGSFALADDDRDWAVSEAQVFVPELLQREYFTSHPSHEAKGGERRKPIFAQAKFGVNSETLGPLGYMGPEILQARTSLPKRGLQPQLNASMSSYEVMAGDTLGTISKKLYGTVDRWMELAHLNNLGNGSLIFPKEILFYVKDAQILGTR
jgi:nucleoid-associated protein YgaU